MQGLACVARARTAARRGRGAGAARRSARSSRSSRAAAVGARGTCAAEQTRENTEQRGEAALLKIKIKGVAEGWRRRYTPRHVVVR